MYPSRSNAARCASVMRTGAGGAAGLGATSVLIEVSPLVVVTPDRRCEDPLPLRADRKSRRSADAKRTVIWTKDRLLSDQRREIGAQQRTQLRERAHTLRLHQARCDPEQFGHG